MSETDRILRRYAERDASQVLSGFWTLENPVVLHIAQERERIAIACLRNCSGLKMSEARILDMGCGSGGEFANYLRWGADMKNLFGLDLMFPRLQAAKARFPAGLVNASGDALPFADGSFDLVCQNVVFSSIIDSTMRRQVAAEMLRVLRPGGFLIWYDAFRTRGRDPHFRSVSLKEVQELFPGMQFSFQKLTTDLGLLKRFYSLCGHQGLTLLDTLGLCKTHVFAVGVRG